MSTIKEVVFMHEKTGEIYLGFSVHFSILRLKNHVVGPLRLFVCDPQLRALGFKEWVKDWEFIGYI
jgi:hypothetical protein